MVAALDAMTLFILVVFASAHKNHHTPNRTVVTVTKYEGDYCTGAEISSNTFPEGMCLANSSLNATDSFEYHCHSVVRPICAFFRFNCTHGNIHGKVEEFPCDICSVSGILHPTVYNFSCSASLQKVIFNTNCTDGCAFCNQSVDLRPGVCSSHGNGITRELVSVGRCRQKVMTVSFSERNCSGTRRITGLIPSGECDIQRKETKFVTQSKNRFP